MHCLVFGRLHSVSTRDHGYNTDIFSAGAYPTFILEIEQVRINWNPMTVEKTLSGSGAIPTPIDVPNNRLRKIFVPHSTQRILSDIPEAEIFRFLRPMSRPIE